MKGIVGDKKLAHVEEVRNFLTYIVQFAFDHECCLLDKFAMGGEGLVKFYASGSQFFATYTLAGGLREHELVIPFEEFVEWTRDHCHSIVKKDGSEYCYVYPTEDKDDDGGEMA